MLKQWLNTKIVLSLFLGGFLNLLMCSVTWADETIHPENHLYSTRTQWVSQQIDLLKSRLLQANFLMKKLQKQHDASMSLAADRVNKSMLDQAVLDISVAKSNGDSINIELIECQQTINRLEKNVREIQNQLNVFNVFGLKIERNGSPNEARLRYQLEYQVNVLQLEKIRATSLQELQSVADSILQLYKAKYSHIESLLKSQRVLLLKEQQAEAELGFEQQQSRWLQRLHTLQLQLTQLEQSKESNKIVYSQLQNEIFYVNENVNFSYIEMLMARYQEQIQQLKISVSRSSSITLLNKASDQAQLLGKQLARINQLLKARVDILAKRKKYLLQSGAAIDSYQADLVKLDAQYKIALQKILNLDQSLASFRYTLDQALQQELSARQNLPGLGSKAWLDLGSELFLVPNLVFQILKSLSQAVSVSFSQITWWVGGVLFFLQIAWVTAFIFLRYFLRRVVVRMPDHEFGHINLKWLMVKLLDRNLLDIAIIGNFFWLFSFLAVPIENFIILVDLALVWLFFKSLIMMARLYLVETVHDRAGHDVRLYHRLKWVFLVGGVITALTIFMHQLPVIYEIKDLFDRLFLLFLLVASIFLLKEWELLPGLILPYIDERRTYLKRVVRLLGMLIPLILLVNSIIGLFGFVNLILTVSGYESIFILVLVAYLILRGLLNDGMEWISKMLIRHVVNGWLWTEAFLKPIDRVLRIMLFLSAWVVLFLFYGWNQQSPVVERLNKLLHYHLIDVLNTTITPLSFIQLAVVISLLYWAVRWTREFMYRLLLSRTKDLGLRNSLAILTQYAMIICGVFIALRMLGIDFRALAVVATAFAFGVGLGLRDLVNNFACGFLLLIERPLRVGDIVSVSGFEGDVMNIGSRAVTIRTWDHMEVLIPNAEIFSKSFTNWTAKDSIVRSVISLKINRHDNPQDVQNIILQVLNHHKNVLTDPAPEVLLKELADGLTEFEVRYYINLRQVKSRVSLRSEVLMDIWQAFDKNGIQPPYPQHEIYFKGGGAPLSG